MYPPLRMCEPLSTKHLLLWERNLPYRSKPHFIVAQAFKSCRIPSLYMNKLCVETGHQAAGHRKLRSMGTAAQSVPREGGLVYIARQTQVLSQSRSYPYRFFAAASQ